MATFIAIIIFIFLFVYLFNRKEKVTVNQQAYPLLNNLLDAKELHYNRIEVASSPSIIATQKIPENKGPEKNVAAIKVESFIPGLNNDVFRDKYDDNSNEDYSYLSPDEARAELKERKENGEYLTNEEYYGYMDAINAEKYDKWLSQIENMEPKEVLTWFIRKRNSDTRMSTAVWRSVGEKVGAYHEEELLFMLEKISGGRVEGWVNARKREGYFFTQQVYDAAKAKRIEYLQKPSKKTSK